MDNGLKSLRDLFARRTIFHVPRYQRAYAWGEEQLDDFVEDFRNQDPKKDYFFGTVLFQQRGDQDGFEIIDIVDGQQRITTLVIFMKELTARLNAGGTDIDVDMLVETYLSYRDRQKLRVIEQDRNFFDTYVARDGQNAAAHAETPSQKRLVEAKSYFRKRLAQLEASEVTALVAKIDRTRVLVYTVNDTAQATLIFETTNDRGKPLTGLEKTKSFLMYQTYVIAESPDDHLERLQSRFARIYRDHEKFEDRLSEDNLLRYHFIGHETWSSSKDRREYNDSIRAVKQALHDAAKQDAARAMAYVDRYSGSLCETFGTASRLLTQPPLCLAALLHLGRMANFYPIIFKTFDACGDVAHAGWNRIMRLLEIISFRVYGIQRRRSNTGQDRLYQCARDFSGDFDELAAQLKVFVAAYANDKDFRYRLASPNFFNEVEGRVQNYLFWTYENHLRTTAQPVAPPMSIDALTSRDTRLKMSIEHIAPVTPTASKVIAEGKPLPEYDDGFRDNYLHCVGNLTIDPLSANSSKQNISFEDKNARYFSKAPFKTQIELPRFLDDTTGGWSAESIARRRDELIAFATDLWDATTV